MANLADFWAQSVCVLSVAWLCVLSVLSRQCDIRLPVTWVYIPLTDTSTSCVTRVSLHVSVSVTVCQECDILCVVGRVQVCVFSSFSQVLLDSLCRDICCVGCSIVRVRAGACWAGLRWVVVPRCVSVSAVLHATHLPCVCTLTCRRGARACQAIVWVSRGEVIVLLCYCGRRYYYV